MAEALAMNRPVVATAFGGALDIVEDGVNGVRVPVSAADAQGFAAALVQALEKTWGDVRTPALEKFSFERMIDRSLAVYARFDPARPAPGVRSLPRRDR
jgi:glycosyltransferase involved in cell wall biosynthesis